MERAVGILLVVAFAACSGGPAAPTPSTPLGRSVAPHHTVGLGPVVGTHFGGQIFGWDMDQNGNDGVLTETVTEVNGSSFNAVEMFDQPTGKITKVVRTGVSRTGDIEPVAFAVAGKDVGIIDHEHVFFQRDVRKDIYRHDRFELMNPLSNGKITARTAPPNFTGAVPDYMTDNQASASQALLVHVPNGRGEGVALYSYDAATKAWGKPVAFPKTQLYNPFSHIYAAIDAQTNESVVGFLGEPRYNPHESPTFVVRNATTSRRLRSFYGVGYGYPNGMAIDSTTGVMCTTTTGDMDVEFYKLATGKGKAVQIPTMYGKGGGETNGADVAVDPIHHLFLVAQLNSTFSPSGGSTIIVYDERGKIVEHIDGFSFNSTYSVVIPHVAVNPSQRTGYVNGPVLTALQEFSY